jgi:CRP-like cAMP-binding protein
LRAAPYLDTAGGEIVRLLTPEQRQQLASIASSMTVPRGRILYREGTTAAAVYFCTAGAVKTFREFRSGRRRVTAFVFADDIFGLAEHGRYLNTAQTIAQTSCYQIPVQVLSAVLHQDPALQHLFVLKLLHEIRESQRRTIVMGRRDATGRFAMFLMMLMRQQPAEAARSVIPLPMTRTDIADYLGHSLEAVSRATTKLVKQGIIAFPGRHQVQVLDPDRLTRLATSV